MSSDHDDYEEGWEGPELSTCTVEASGPFGSATWVVAKKLYDVLPRETRDQLLDMTGDRKIAPFFTRTCERILRQAGCSTDANTLNPEWSFKTRDVTCIFGQVTWQIGNGFLEGVPEDQRETLLEMADVLIHDYFHTGLFDPLMQYAFRRLHG